jgi:hypothetical protein
MLFPPSLPEEVLARSFRSGNGELGLVPGDVPAFLDACERDGAQLLGWEFWIADHQPNDGFTRPEPAPGVWFGGIPMIDSPLPNIIQGDGNLADIRRELPMIRKHLAQVHPDWAAHVRINFTFD